MTIGIIVLIFIRLFLMIVTTVTEESQCCVEMKTLIYQNNFLKWVRKFIRWRFYAMLTSKSIADALDQSLTICFLYVSF
jgi:hypothetical protein